MIEDLLSKENRNDNPKVLRTIIVLDLEKYCTVHIRVYVLWITSQKGDIRIRVVICTVHDLCNKSKYRMRIGGQRNGSKNDDKITTLSSSVISNKNTILRTERTAFYMQYPSWKQKKTPLHIHRRRGLTTQFGLSMNRTACMHWQFKLLKTI